MSCQIPKLKKMANLTAIQVCWPSLFVLNIEVIVMYDGPQQQVCFC